MFQTFFFQGKPYYLKEPLHQSECVHISKGTIAGTGEMLNYMQLQTDNPKYFIKVTNNNLNIL